MGIALVTKCITYVYVSTKVGTGDAYHSTYVAVKFITGGISVWQGV